MNKKVYISSTYEDLIEYRKAVYQVLNKMGFSVRAMEDYVARDSKMVDQVQNDVAACDIYIGIFAWRYGHIPPKRNPKQLSVTELEYREAEAKGKRLLIFLVDAKAPWESKFKDTLKKENEKGNRILSLREELTDRMCGLFTTPEDLAVQVAATLFLAISDAKVQMLSGNLSNASYLTMRSSAIPEILSNMKCAITEEVKADVIKINLGQGKYWWSTRLHLLAALCADYTEVRQLLFETDDNRFLGMCTPSQARRALAHVFPNIENAYRKSILPATKISYDPVEDVNFIIEKFSHAMDYLGGEQKVKRFVEPHIIKDWPGISKDCIDLYDQPISSAILETVVRKPTSFVVIVRNNIIQQVVDRVALATHIAVGA